MPNKILDDLIAAGVPSDTILAVAELITLARITEERRTKNRDRMRGVRTHARTAVHTDAHGNTPPVHILPPLKEKKDSMRRGTRLPSDWHPDEEDCRFAAKLGLNPSMVSAKFIDYWRARAGSGAVKLDWHATWRTWCRTEHERNKPNGSGRPPGIL